MKKETIRFALEMDACSRVTIALINRANRKSICRFGDLTHDPHGGFISGDGQVRVSGDASYVGVRPASIQYSNCVLHPPAGWVPAPGAMVIPPELCEKMNWISPYQIPTLLTELTGQNDFVFLSRALRLDKLDFDNIHGTMSRAFVENTPSASYSIPKDYTPLPIRDHDGFFARMNVFYNGAVFDLKTFQHTKFGICPLPFIPKHSGVWFKTPDALPPAGYIVLDTRIGDILNGRSPANAGLIDAGNIASLDWAIFLGHKVSYLWRPNEYQSRNTFAAALHFVSEAKKHGIEAVILSYSSLTSAGQEILELPAIIKQARAYNLDIPANLKSNGYIDCSLPQDFFIPNDIPAFWQSDGITLFYGPGHKAILRNLLRAFGRIPSDAPDAPFVSQVTDMQDGVDQYVFPKKKVGLLYPPSATSRITKLVGEARAAVPRISSAILQDDGALETALSDHAIEAMFIAYADEFPEKELASVLDICGRMGVVTGAFTAAEVVSASDAVMELVSQRFYVNVNDTNPDSVFAKDMKARAVKNYIFEGDGMVSVTDSDEVSINRKA